MRKFAFATFCCLFIGSSLYLLAMHILDKSQENVTPSVTVTMADRAAWTKTAVRAGETVHRDRLQWRPFTGDTLPERALLLQSDWDGVDPAAVFSRDLIAGTKVKISDIRGPGDPGYVPALLKRGFRAKALAIENLSEYEGFVHQGDTIDILFKSTDEVQDGGGKKLSVRPLIRNAKIIGPVSRSGTLMVALKVQDAVKASLAEEVGKLSILLRNREEKREKEEDRIPVATLADLRSEEAFKSPTTAQAQTQSIRVMRGSGLNTITVTGRSVERWNSDK